MDDICIVTDSTCDLPQHLQDPRINIVPLKVCFGDTEYLDSIDIRPKDFYSRLRDQVELPSTSQPSPGDFLGTYNKLKQQGINKVISIHLSAKLSGTVQSAINASGMVKGIDVRVIDSKSASLGLGFLCLAAIDYLKQSPDFNQIIERIQADIAKVRAFFTVGSLDYLEKGGRIGKAKALLGKLFDFKPILSIQGGEISAVEKISGSFETAIERIAALLKDNIDSRDTIRFLGVVHSCLEQDSASLVSLLKQDLTGVQITISELGCVLGSHVGPQVIGVVAL